MSFDFTSKSCFISGLVGSVHGFELYWSSFSRVYSMKKKNGRNLSRTEAVETRTHCGASLLFPSKLVIHMPSTQREAPQQTVIVDRVWHWCIFHTLYYKTYSFESEFCATFKAAVKSAKSLLCLGAVYRLMNYITWGKVANLHSK